MGSISSTLKQTAQDSAQTTDLKYIKAGVGLLFGGIGLFVIGLPLLAVSKGLGVIFILFGIVCIIVGAVLYTQYSKKFTSDAPPPIDCAVSWGTPSNCSGACGGGSGTVTITGTVTTQPAYGGASCPSGSVTNSDGSTSTFTTNSDGSITQTKTCTNNTSCSASTPTWTYKGCYKESTPRSLPTQASGTFTVDTCKAAALAALGSTSGVTVGLQYNGQCWYGLNSNYSQYGVQTDTTQCPTLGGSWTNQVYQYT